MPTFSDRATLLRDIERLLKLMMHQGHYRAREWYAEKSLWKGMRIQVSKREDFARVNKWIEVYIILYNIFRSFDDKWDDEEPEEDVEPEVEEESNFGTFYCFN